MKIIYITFVHFCVCLLFGRGLSSLLIDVVSCYVVCDCGVTCHIHECVWGSGTSLEDGGVIVAFPGHIYFVF